MITTLKISKDKNGNRTITVRTSDKKTILVQTNGSLPETHRNGICDETLSEIRQYVKTYGGAVNREALGIT